MNISPLIAIVPVVLAVALIIIVVRRNITERQPGEPIDIAGAIPAFVVLMVAVVFIGGMASSVAPYHWDEEGRELTINQDVGAGSQKWDSLGADVKSLILNDNVTSVADGAFDTLTGLEHISISDSVESITSSAFGVTLKDCMDQTITAPEAGEYVGTGDGTLYRADPSIYTTEVQSSGIIITGFASDYAESIVAALPSKINGYPITNVGASAFANNLTLTKVVSHELVLSYVGASAFDGCSNLALFDADTISMGNYGFRNCGSLTTTSITSLTVGARYTFQNCASLTNLDMSKITEINSYTFNNCSSLTEVDLSSITTIGGVSFTGVTAITKVSFGSGLATVSSSAFGSWTFYDTDGTTVLDKTVASNLAGFTFEGTAAALVKVAPGLLSLTPDQLQQVHLHDQELQTMLDQPSIDPLPFQPSLQTQEQEPASA